MKSAGIHHVTAIAADPQRNVDFHAGVLGLRLVKRTINFDDPGTYHLYYGDQPGSPGTLVTFFPWPGARRGRLGAGETAATAYRIPRGSGSWWRTRLAAHGVAWNEAPRFGAPVLAFADPDGMRFELIEDEGLDGVRPWSGGGVPEEHAIRGFHSVSLASLRPDRTREVLVDLLGFTPSGEEGGRKRFVAGGEGPGTIVDLVEGAPGEAGSSRAPGKAGSGEPGAGSVHHVAFRARDAAHQLEFQKALAGHGLRVTDVADRCYFQSIYFREPGGVLFEIATDPPGMTLDEPLDRLGEALRLPPWFEGMRPQLERTLPELRVPAGAGS